MQYSQGGSFIRRDGDTVPGNMVWEGTQNMQAKIFMDNSVPIQWKNAAGDTRTMLNVESNDVLSIGHLAFPMYLLNDGDLLDETSLGRASIGAIAHGTSTGDGATSQAITGLNFAPAYVKIWEPGATGEPVETFETTAEVVDDDAGGMAFVQNFTATGLQARLKDDAIGSFDAEGFTVDDNGADEHPNKNSIVYAYYVIG